MTSKRKIKESDEVEEPPQKKVHRKSVGDAESEGNDEGENVVQKLDKAIASINKGADKKEEMRLLMGRYADWDHFLSPAPLSIALLGQLILVSTNTDFSLQDKRKEEKERMKFTFLKYPDSFRASLVQISNRGWGAFNKAHSCMDQIRLYSGNVDKHVKTAVKFLVSGSPQEVELMVPDALKSIDNIGDECKVLAESVKKEFVFIMDMIEELLEACTRAKGHYKRDVKEAKIAIDVAEKRKEALEQEKQQAEEKREKMERRMNEAEKYFKEALESMPNAGKLVGLAITDMLFGVARCATDFIGAAKGTVSKKMNNSVGAEGSTDPNSSAESDDKQSLFKLVQEIRVQMTVLFDLACCGKNDDGKEQPKWNDIENSRGGAQWIKKTFESIQKYRLPANESEMRREMNSLCCEGINVCDKLLNLNKQMSKEVKEIEDVMTLAWGLSRQVETLVAASQISVGGNSLPNRPPHHSKQRSVQSGACDGGGMVKSAIDSYRFKTETAKEMLKDTRHMYDKSCDDAARNMKETGEVLVELAKINLEKVDHETIIEMLRKGLKELGDLKEQWGKLVEFFDMLSNLVKCCLRTSLKTFIKTSENQKELSEVDQVMSDRMRDVIFEQAFQANQFAYVVNSISSVYVEVSEKYLMDPISCLGKLIGLDPVKDEREFTLKREELNEGCKKAQDAIRRIALEKKEQMMEALDKRIGRIKMEVEALLPPISKTEAKEIQDRVKAGVAMGKAAIEEEDDDLV